MKKLIESTQKIEVECDNPTCDFNIPCDQALNLHPAHFIDMPCPKCGDNLLTEQDYLQHQRMLKIVKWINKWFIWITIFYSKKKLNNISIVSIKCHNGITIKKED